MNALEKLSYGTFVLTIKKDSIKNACILNTVIQINEDTLLMSLSNYSFSRSLLDEEGYVGIHTIHNQAPKKLFEMFGYKSGRNGNKLEGVDLQEEERFILLKEGINSYFKGKVIQKVLLTTHTLFIVRILDSKVCNTIPSLTYKEYQEIVKPLKKTERNLQEAFASESMARNKYTYYASIAKKEGYPNISELFLTIGDNEKEHAKIWYKKTGHLQGNTEENIREAILSENQEWQKTYKRYEIEALEEGKEDLANYFHLIQSIEKEHAAKFYSVLDDMRKDKLFKAETEVSWICRNCGYVYTGKEALMLCPMCEHPQGFIERRNYNENV